MIILIFIENLLGCVCNTFIDEYGHGNCTMEYSGRVGCFVKEPTTCKDNIIFSNKNYSASQACNQRLGEFIIQPNYNIPIYNYLIFFTSKKLSILFFYYYIN